MDAAQIESIIRREYGRNAAQSMVAGARFISFAAIMAGIAAPGWSLLPITAPPDRNPVRQPDEVACEVV
jgi:hypothetical protein